MTKEEKHQKRELKDMADRIQNLEDVAKQMPAEERQNYLDAQQSVIDARHQAEAEGHLWIGYSIV